MRDWRCGAAAARRRCRGDGREISGATLLSGIRGTAGRYPSLARCLYSLREFAYADRARIAEIDLNPIKVLPEDKGCRILDALIVPRT